MYKRRAGRLSCALAAGTFLMAGALFAAGCGGSGAAVSDTVKVQNVEDHVIRVSSREQVKVEPDMAEILYSVYSQASDAQTCQTQNGTDVNRVIEFLKGMGVEEKSIQTSQYGLNPMYDWSSGKTITGYEMNTQVAVSDIPMDRVGDILSGGVEAGINSVDSVTYLASNYDKAYQEALTKAIEAARVKAEAMAAAGGCRLGAIVNVEEYGDSQQARYNGYRSMDAGAAEKASGAFDLAVMPGQVDVEASITVDFAIE